jgi:serine/threonine-protein kinase
MVLEHGFPPAPGSIVDDKFVVTRLIGTGGTGVVLAARELSLGRLVAIKLLHPELATSSDVVERFLREARATSRLKSEHVVGVIGLGTLPSGIPYYVMEYLTGTDLHARLQERGPFTIDEVLDYVLQALEAIAEAHRHGIVHRDLKPSNLWLTTREDDSDFVKVLDFGTSKLRKTDLTLKELVTRSGSLLGSPLYMSPEQIRNASDVDARSDIWSIGVVMHELLTGHPPFQGRFLAEIIGAVCGDDYLVPAREDLPAELAEILMRCLQKEPNDRFQSVEALARAFLPIIRTVASQVSIERILRLPSSAPPPRPELLVLPSDGLVGDVLANDGLGDVSLMDTLENPMSVANAPPESDAKSSRAARVRRRWLTPLAFLALGAAGTLTWLRLRSVLSESPAAVRPAPASALATNPKGGESALSTATPPANAVEPERHGASTRARVAQGRPSATPSAAVRPAQSGTTPATEPESLAPVRQLDGNPFEHQ